MKLRRRMITIVFGRANRIAVSEVLRPRRNEVHSGLHWDAISGPCGVRSHSRTCAIPLLCVCRTTLLRLGLRRLRPVPQTSSCPPPARNHAARPLAHPGGLLPWTLSGSDLRCGKPNCYCARREFLDAVRGAPAANTQFPALARQSRNSGDGRIRPKNSAELPVWHGRAEVVEGRHAGGFDRRSRPGRDPLGAGQHAEACQMRWTPSVGQKIERP